MNTLVKYLEGGRSKMGMKSDRALALRVGITQSSMHNIMAGMSTPSDDTCMKIAELAGDDPARVIALAHMAKAPGASKKAWDKIFKAVTAASFSFFLTNSLTLHALFPASAVK
jgi:DNA-binding XRE family transcriptional regulator